MRSLFLALALTGSLAATAPALTACQTTSQASAHLNAAKGLYIAELAYSGLASAIVAAHASGALQGDRLDQAKAAEAKAYETLLLARQGRASADQVIDALSAAQTLVPAQ